MSNSYVDFLQISQPLLASIEVPVTKNIICIGHIDNSQTAA